MSSEVAETFEMTNSLSLGDAAETNPSSLASIIKRAKAGESSAFEQLIALHQRKVMSTAWRMLGSKEDARDAAQEAFLRAYKYLDSFKLDQDFAGWLYRIVINVCRDHARKRNRHFQFSSYESERELGKLDSLASDDNVEADAIKSQQRSLVAAALETLTRKERAALTLRDLEGLPTEEVARILGTTQATVRSQAASARAKIKLFRDRTLKENRRR
jgi:RNA polymerase sigma-70 factor, ECF subfamily